MTRVDAEENRVEAGLDRIGELVRRTAERQGLPAELEDVTVARRVASIIATARDRGAMLEPPGERERPPRSEGRSSETSTGGGVEITVPEPSGMAT